MRLLFFIFAICLLVGNGTPVRADAISPFSGSAVIREMNLARTNPAHYAAYVEELKTHFRGRMLVLTGRTMVHSTEGPAALDEAIRFLQHAQPRSPLVSSPGMCRAAADHCADQANGAIGHGGRDFSSPGSRLNRYGRWSVRAGENISYGQATARAVVLALIIDDGLPSRKHRENIFNPDYAFAGAAFGPHARYRNVCSIEFAGGYTERGSAPNESLLARNSFPRDFQRLAGN